MWCVMVVDWTGDIWCRAYVVDIIQHWSLRRLLRWCQRLSYVTHCSGEHGQLHSDEDAAWTLPNIYCLVLRMSAGSIIDSYGSMVKSSSSLCVRYWRWSQAIGRTFLIGCIVLSSILQEFVARPLRQLSALRFAYSIPSCESVATSARLSRVCMKLSKEHCRHLCVMIMLHNFETSR